MAARLAILDDYQHVALEAADWKSLEGEVDIRVFHDHIKGEDAVTQALADFDIIVAMRERTPFPASLLQKLPNLKLLVTTGMRNLAIDMEAARKQGVPVCGTALLPYPAFEHTWALILALLKKIPEENQNMHAGGWQSGIIEGARGKTLGVIGLGKLGSQVAKIGVAFGMNVIAWSQNLTEERARECGATRVEKDELLARSDVVTVHVLLSDRTRGLIGQRELALMKPTTYLVNTSRGPIVEEAALLEALQGQRIAGAGIDVYDVEPLPPDHPLRKCDNAVLTGHTAYVIRETYELAYGEALEDVKAWLKGEPIRVLNAA
jgi:phosphoglycerate dehydrogenase-like enzyme